MSEYKIKPCPFCGGKVEIKKLKKLREIRKDSIYFSICTNCLVQSRQFAKNKEQAISGWNIFASAWIPVDDRLPETVQTCYVAYNDWDILKSDWDNLTHVRKLGYMPDVGHWNIKKPIRVLAWKPISKLLGGDANV